jgi:hypothetical protein
MAERWRDGLRDDEKCSGSSLGDAQFWIRFANESKRPNLTSLIEK